MDFEFFLKITVYVGVTATAITGIITFAAKSIFKHFLEKDLAVSKIQLKAEYDNTIMQLQTNLI